MTRKEMCPDLVRDRDLPLMSRKEKERDQETLADSRREKSIGNWESELGITIWGGRRRRGPWETLEHLHDLRRVFQKTEDASQE